MEPHMDHDNFDPEYVFSHHHASPEKLAAFSALHDGAKDFAKVILANVPQCSDRIEVLRLLREASMLACAAVSLEGRFK
jgi:hypothetical protein